MTDHVPCPRCGEPADVGVHDSAKCSACFHSFRASHAQPAPPERLFEPAPNQLAGQTHLDTDTSNEGEQAMSDHLEEHTIALWRPSDQHPWREWESDKSDDVRGELRDFVPLDVVTTDTGQPYDVEAQRRKRARGELPSVEDRLEVQQLEREQDEPLRDLLDLIDGHDDEYPAGAADALRAVLRDAKRNLAHEPIIIYEAELGGWDARCSCGWRSAGTFPSEEKAGAEADKHVQAHGDDGDDACRDARP